MHARRFEDLRSHVDADIHTLYTALQHMAMPWPSSRMFCSTFDKLLATDLQAAPGGQYVHGNNLNGGAEAGQGRTSGMLDVNDDDGGDGDGDGDGDAEWMEAFPFVTEETTPLIKEVLTRNLAMPFPGLDWPLDINASLQELLALPSDFSFDMNGL